MLVGIPLAIIAVLALLTLPGGRKRTRYKPGQPWNHAPVWYEPHPEHAPAAGHGETKAIGSSVYGEPTETPIAETHPTAPINAYGQTKLAIEQALPHFERAERPGDVVAVVTDRIADRIAHR